VQVGIAKRIDKLYREANAGKAGSTGLLGRLERTKKMITALVLQQYRDCPEAFSVDIDPVISGTDRKRVRSTVAAKKRVVIAAFKAANPPLRTVNHQEILSRIREKVKSQPEQVEEAVKPSFGGWNKG
jgi:hypothetical protein